MFFLKKNFSPDLDIATLEQRKEKTGTLDVSFGVGLPDRPTI